MKELKWRQTTSPRAKLWQRQREKWNRQWLAAHSSRRNIAFYNKVKLSVSIDSLLCYYYPKETELRERIYVKHSIVKHFRYRYQWLWTKFRQRHANLLKLQHGKVWNSDRGHKDSPNRVPRIGSGFLPCPPIADGNLLALLQINPLAVSCEYLHYKF